MYARNKAFYPIASGNDSNRTDESMRLVHPQDLVRFDTGESLHGSAGPLDLDAGDPIFRTKSEMYSAVAGGHEAHTHGVLVMKDASRAGCQFEFCANRIARAFMSISINQQPEIATVSRVHQDTGTLMERRHD